jgi:hypothetical protein
VKFAFFIAASAVVLATSVCAQQAERNIPPNTGTTGSVVTNGDAPAVPPRVEPSPGLPSREPSENSGPGGSSASGPAPGGQK